MEEINFKHSDAIIIKINIRGVEIRRLIIDKGSSCDILYLDLFMKMRIKPSCIKPYAGGLVSFTGHEAPNTGMIILPLTLGEHPQTTNEIIDFLVMDLPSSYNGITGRVSQSSMGVIPSV